ncbi:MAG: hypothetical protein JJT78_09805 [Leptospira sp.]|nr:hypothetical protein [Leptospira sp.]
MHNIYFSWVRILLFISIIAGSLYVTRYFNPQPVDVEIKEEDFKEYLVNREKWNSEVEYMENGENRNYGNLVAMQPYFLNLDFYSEENFKSSIEAVLIKAKEKKAMDRKTLIVFPEHTGTGLVLLGEKRPAFFSETWKESLKFLKLYYKSEVFKNLDDYQSDSNDEVTIAEIIQSKRELIASAYHETFSSLAKKYSVSIIAGSILLPNPTIKNGKLISQEGDIYHVSVAYLSSGKAIEPLVRKVHLTDWEKEFVKPGDIKQDFIVKVPAWTVGNLIGEDSLNESIYKSIGSKNMDGIVAPSSSFVEPNWKELGIQANEIPTNDLWIENGISKYISNTKGKDNLQAFWKGDLWNLEPKGETFTNRSSNNLQRSGDSKGPKVMNLYF